MKRGWKIKKDAPKQKDEETIIQWKMILHSLIISLSLSRAHYTIMAATDFWNGRVSMCSSPSGGSRSIALRMNCWTLNGVLRCRSRVFVDNLIGWILWL